MVAPPRILRAAIVLREPRYLTAALNFLEPMPLSSC